MPEKVLSVKSKKPPKVEARKSADPKPLEKPATKAEASRDLWYRATPKKERWIGKRPSRWLRGGR